MVVHEEHMVVCEGHMVVRGRHMVVRGGHMVVRGRHMVVHEGHMVNGVHEGHMVIDCVIRENGVHEVGLVYIQADDYDGENMDYHNVNFQHDDRYTHQHLVGIRDVLFLNVYNR